MSGNYYLFVYIGLDLIPHFTEKLFAGSVRLSDVHAFMDLGVPYAYAAVILSGCIELACAISISFGFFTRLGSVFLFCYLIIASFLGHHFSLGFIWASSGGGWEYPVFWATLVLTFSVFAPYKFSVDAYLYREYALPRWIKKLIGSAERLK
jgi:putative oxidoreductase